MVLLGGIGIGSFWKPMARVDTVGLQANQTLPVLRRKVFVMRRTLASIMASNGALTRIVLSAATRCFAVDYVDSDLEFLKPFPPHW